MPPTSTTQTPVIGVIGNSWSGLVCGGYAAHERILDEAIRRTAQMTPPPNVKEAVTRLIESECMYFDLSSVLEVHDGSSVYKCGGEG